MRPREKRWPAPAPAGAAGRTPTRGRLHPFRRELLLALLLLLGTAMVFRGASEARFINFDDDVYVTDNAWVRGGLSGAAVRWACTTTAAANWHPLTWLSHMLDVTLFGLDAGRHHAVSVGLHLANTLLLFVLARSLTGNLWASWTTAALFAVHPQHVESVLWVSERKDLLSTLFWLAAMIAYLGYVRRRRRTCYAAAVVAHALALLAKPMPVTLPLTLLLLDFWPLGRWTGRAHTTGPPSLARLVGEKAPFFLLALAAGAVTYVAQEAGDAVKSLAAYPLAWRLENSAVSVLHYLRGTLYPRGLSVFYPFPERGPDIRVAAVGFIILAAVTAAAWRRRSRDPFLLMGWGWFAVTLLPVLGLVKVGDHAMADRYTYVPLIGIFLAAAWGGRALCRASRAASAISAVLAAAGLLAFSGLAAARVADWRDSTSLMQSALEVSAGNWLAHANLGIALATERSDPAGALPHYRESLRLKPEMPQTYNFMGQALGKLGRRAEAMAAYREAIRLYPDYPQAWFNLGLAALGNGDRDLAREAHHRLQEVDPARAARFAVFLGAAGR